MDTERSEETQRATKIFIYHFLCAQWTLCSMIAAGIKIKEDKALPAFNRFSFYDPFNNRIELLEERTAAE